MQNENKDKQSQNNVQESQDWIVKHLWCDMICKCCELSLKNGKSCSCHLSNKNLLTHVINLVNIPPTQHIAIERYLKNQGTIMLPQIQKQEGSHNEISNKSWKVPKFCFQR